MTDHDPLGIAGELIAEKYRIEHLVGEGGFAVVYRARHVIWDRPVAVKFFDGLSRVSSDYRETLQQQFLDEGALLTELSVQTPGIVQARDVGFHTTPEGQWVPYMVLEWLEGSSLEAILAQDRRQGLPWTESEVVGFLKRVLAPLEVAHRHGVTHRDIKPANIFVLGSAARSPETPCKLLDFGVAKIVSDQSTLSAALARTGLAATSFTPQYGAPEQFTRSYGATGPWTDVYALALVASEMLVGSAALQGEDLIQLGFSSANPDRRPTPRSLGARISDALEAVFARALAIHPEDRFANAGEFLKSTLMAAGEVVSAASRSRPPIPSAAIDSGRACSGTMNVVPVAASPGSPIPETQREAAASLPPSPSSSSRESALGIVLVLIIAFGFGTLVYSATSLPGARETRRVLAPVVHEARLVARRLTPSRSGTEPSPNEATGTPASTLAPSAIPSAPNPPDAGPSECPPHTWRINLKAQSVTSTARPRAGARTSVRCMDQAEVSEIDYTTCSKCDKPKTVSPRAGTRTELSEFCASGRAPTAAAIRCVTWKQALAFCRFRGAGLPTRAELIAIGHAGTSQGATSAPEWSAERPSGAQPEFREFRCVATK